MWQMGGGDYVLYQISAPRMLTEGLLGKIPLSKVSQTLPMAYPKKVLSFVGKIEAHNSFTVVLYSTAEFNIQSDSESQLLFASSIFPLHLVPTYLSRTSVLD